jgi:hypothetical protein
VHDGQVNTLESAIFQEMLMQGCLGDFQRSALQLRGRAEAHVSDWMVRKS